MIALSFCPSDRLDEAFEHIKSCKPEVVACDKMLKYFKDTWMTGSYPNCFWNHSETFGPRTNNHIEGFHSKFNRCVGHPKPNIFNLIKLMKRYEAVYKTRHEYIAQGKLIVKRKKNMKKKIVKLKIVCRSWDLII